MDRAPAEADPFSAIDEATLVAAAAWVQRRLGGQTSSEAEMEFQDWLRERPDHAIAYQRLSEIWVDPELYEAARGLPRPHLAMSGVGSRRGLLIAGAALIVGTGALGVWLARPQSGSAFHATLTNPPGPPQRFGLIDGTEIILNGASRLTARYDSGRRILRLEEGESLVRVAHDPRPLSLIAGLAIVTAIGTVFNAELHEGIAELAVIDGIIAVTRARSEGSVRARAGERVNVDAEKIALVADHPLPVTQWVDGWIEVDNAAVEVVVRQLRRRIALEIVVEDPSFLVARVSGRFSLNEPEASLTALAELHGYRVERTLDALVVHSPAD